MKHVWYILVGSAALLSGCGQSAGEGSRNEAGPVAQPEKKHAYCFFKDAEMKGWKVSRDRHGDINVEGEAHVKDPRYKATFGKVAAGPRKAVLDLTISQNDLGYAMRDDWWHVGAIVPNSASLNEATVECGDKIVADMQVPPKG